MNMSEAEILSRLAEIKAEERKLKAMLKALNGEAPKQSRKRPEPIVEGESSFMRMANKIVNAKREV